MSDVALYIVAGPIGNLEDMTYRAVRILKEAGAIYAEDTRVSRKLLDAYDIDRPLHSFREQQPEAARDRVATTVCDLLRAGESVAYLTDAGTPGVSDPGNWLVERVRAEGLAVVPVPGPSALTAILSVSGLPIQRPLFVGFLPKKKGHQTLLKELGWALETKVCDAVVFYESPQRIIKLLSEVGAWPNIQVRLGRELTKRFEEVLVGTPAEVSAILERRTAVKGEMVLLVAPNH
jgi:16S rRNA (cytidine1402-2'-O)-methyltransferase